MVIVTTVNYPPENASEMAKRFLKLPPIPDFMTRRWPYFQSDLKDGIVGFALYELDRSRIVDAKEFLGNYMAIYFGVPGFKYEIKEFMEAAEALKMIGM